MNIRYYLINFLLSFFITLFIIPSIRRIGYKFKLFDKPKKRKEHTKLMVRIGGLALITSFTLVGIIKYFYFSREFSENIFQTKFYLNFLTISFCFFLIGLVDDLKEMSPFSRLAGQILFAVIAWNSNIRFESFNFSWISSGLHNFEFSPSISLILTILWIAGVINAINWIDGLDGLAAGTSAISFLAIFLIAINYNLYFFASIAISLFGCSLAFLKFNFYPSTIFMGDGGSYFLGFCNAALPLILCDLVNTNSQESQVNQLLNMNIFFIILFIPIIDMLIVMVSRIIALKSPFFPDRRHLHHRLQISGISHQQTVFLSYSITLCTSSLALFLINKQYYLLFLICMIICFSLLIKYKNSIIKTLKLTIQNKDI